MLDLMRRFFIVISILVALLALAAGVGYVYVKQMLSKLPVENLEFSIAGFAYKHVRLDHLEFTYIDNTQEPALRAPVRLDDVFITWEWQAFRPNFQIIEVGQLQASLNQWPTLANEVVGELVETDAEDGFELEKWQLPDDWRITADIPHLLQIEQLSLDLPCAEQRCQYSGELYFESTNKERLIVPDEPQVTNLRLKLSPYQDFAEMEQLDLLINYEVAGELPSLAVNLHSPGHLQVVMTQHLDRSNRLRGEIEAQFEPSAVWISDHLSLWYPELEHSLPPALELFSDSVNIDLDIQAELPNTQLSRWQNELTGALQGSLELTNQVIIGVQSRLERGAEIQFSGDTTLTLLPDLYPNLRGYLTDSLGDSPGDTFYSYAAQLSEPVRGEFSWQFEFPPGTIPASWHRQADGQADFNLTPANWLQLDNIGRIRPQASGEVHFTAGQLAHLDLLAEGKFEATEMTDALAELGLQPGTLNWSVHAQSENQLDLNALPVLLELQSQGATDVSLDSRLLLNIDSDNGTLAAHSEHGLLSLRQAAMQIGDAQLTELTLRVPFTLQLSPELVLQLSSETPAAGSTSLRLPLQDDDIELPAVSLELANWIWRSDLGDAEGLSQSSFQSDIDLNADAVVAPGINAINWRWYGALQSQPLAPAPLANLDGRLTNSAGLVLRNQSDLAAENLVVDWQLTDIFWLAGNPIAGTLADWPELVSLERGRGRAAGQLTLPLDGSAPQLTATAALSDTAGIYDTIDFGGANADLELSTDFETLEVALSNASLQRIQFGLPMGPARFAFNYSASIDQLLAGQLELTDNQLSLLSGDIGIENRIYDLSRDEITLQVDITQLDLQQLLSEYPATDIHGQGLISGAIPIRWRAGQGFMVDDGRIHALAPGGVIQYRAERAQQLRETNQALRIVMDALDDFHYSVLEGGVSYNEDGTLELALSIEGQNPQLEGGRPVRLDITIAEDLPALLASLQLTNQLNNLIQERVQQRLIESLR
ncbi:hypothetical protein CWE14_01470 [Aliidiomarina soli]|uniref:Uncharacterized protein n=2 Tax=Aliidiomarina soli TaxID=1928574 RepID=A0A432WLY8_9GAMM|nr:hypothetical protein CWE14_01470 [Aliidiomarina soli]